MPADCCEDCQRPATDNTVKWYFKQAGIDTDKHLTCQLCYGVYLVVKTVKLVVDIKKALEN